MTAPELLPAAGLFVLLAAVSAVLTRAMIAVAILDVPNARSSHDRPTPKSGGVAVTLALVAGLAGLQLTAGGPGLGRLRGGLGAVCSVVQLLALPLGARRRAIGNRQATMNKFLLKGARVVDPVQGIDGPADVLIAGAVIVAVGRDLAADGARVVELSPAAVVCPGFTPIFFDTRSIRCSAPIREQERFRQICRWYFPTGFRLYIL